MKGLKRLWIWCKRIRHLNGFGVQSPFAFSFIHTVIYQKLPKDIHRQIAGLLRTSPYAIVRPLPGRTQRLLYKATAYNKPAVAIYIEREFSGGVYCMSEGGQCLPITMLEKQPEERQGRKERASSLRQLYHGDLGRELRHKLQAHASPDLIYLDLNASHADELSELLLQRCRQNTMLIAGNIHENKMNLTLWRNITQDKRTGISFDLYEVGIVLFDKHYYHEHYTINFEGFGY